MGVSLKFNKPEITPKFTFRLLVLVFWSQHTILKFVSEVIERLPFVSSFSDYFVPFLFISLFALSSPYIFRQIRIPDVLFALSIILVVVMTLLIYSESSEYINPELWRIFGLAVPLYFVGVIYDHEETKRDLFFVSLVGVVVMFTYQLYKLGTGRALETDNMSASYDTLPSIMYIIYWAVANKGVKNWILAASASCLAFVFGTRGPILAIVVFFSIGIIYKVLSMRNVVVKFIIILTISVLIVYVLSGDTIISIAMSLSEKFGEIGFSTRIFDFIIEEQIAESAGREKLNEAVFDAIKQNPVLGYGFMGDRAVIGFYTHNIILEILCSYGVFIGSGLLILVGAFPIVTFIKNRRETSSWFLMMLICMVFIKLLFSGSYVYEPYFYLLFGFCTGMLRRNQRLQNVY